MSPRDGWVMEAALESEDEVPIRVKPRARISRRKRG